MPKTLPSVGVRLSLTLAGADDADAAFWPGVRERAPSVSRCRNSDSDGRSVEGRIVERSRDGPSPDRVVESLGSALEGGPVDRLGERSRDGRFNTLDGRLLRGGLLERLGCEEFLAGPVKGAGAERFSQGLLDRLGSERPVDEWSDRVLMLSRRLFNVPRLFDGCGE